jgi:triosephosphate isomerase
MKRRKLVVANWKMNLTTQQASLLLHRIHERIHIHRDIETVLCPSHLHIQPLSVQIDKRKFKLGAQNGHYQDHGPYTGEISFTMLRGIADYVLVGHSERRTLFNESLDDVRKKVAATFRNDITPILCIGERKDERLAGETKQVVHDQLTSAIADITAEQVAEMVIAYEPIWAISSGDDYKDHEIATPDDAKQIASYIRKQIESIYGVYASHAVRILYGASVNRENARSFLDAEGVDGVLVGGASLNYQEFAAIVQAAYRSIHNLPLGGN